MQKEMLGVPLDWSDPINQGLVMCLRMNEGMGDKIYDGSLNGNHGVLKNMTHPGTPTSGWTPGTRGVGLVFDGVDDYVNCGNNGSLDITGAITLSMWIYPTDLTTDAYLVAKRDGSASQYGFLIGPSGYQILTFGVNASIIAPTGSLTLNQWQHCVGVYDGVGVGEIYINSVPKAVDTTADPITTAVTDIFIGARGDGAGGVVYKFCGGIDEVRLYNRALSAAEVNDLYIAGNPTSASVGTPVKYFIFDAETTAPSETFALPLEATGTYDFEVSWGDGNTEVISAWNVAAVTHTYASAGTHQIVINGTLLGWRFNNAGDCAKMRDIKAWGCLRLGNSNGYFYGCTGLTVSATDSLNLVGTTDFQSMFRVCSSLTTVPSMNSWDVSSVTSMRYMFYDATAFNQDIGSWDVSSVTNMYTMFYSASAFNQDISSWDVANVADMKLMFRSTSSFDQNIGSWDITSLTDATTMFTNVTLSTANYDALLTGWEAQAVQNNVTFSGGNSKYSAGAAATARQALIDDHVWVITDGGQV